MARPHLTFACELETPALQALLSDAIIADLVQYGAALSLGILDLSPERAEIVRRLNQAGLPVIAWLLLPREQGYYFNIGTASQAAAFYRDFRQWMSAEGLMFAAIGLDIEPDLRDYADLAFDRWRHLPKWIGRVFRFRQFHRACRIYTDLVEAIHQDGFLVETYQFPLIVDDRAARTTLIQRLTGMVDLPADREVLMLYSSHLRPRGAAVLASYAPQADAVGVGSTGGGVEGPGVPKFDPITWDEFARDLRLAYHYTDQIFIFSLEGCVRNGYMENLKDFIWDMPILLPETGLMQVDAARRSLWSGLWLAERLPWILGGLASIFLIWRGVRKRRTK